jgi:hypothetical protein
LTTLLMHFLESIDIGGYGALLKAGTTMELFAA